MEKYDVMFAVGVVERHNGEETLLWGKKTPSFTEAVKTFKKKCKDVGAFEVVYIRSCAFGNVWCDVCEYNGSDKWFTYMAGGDSVSGAL